MADQRITYRDLITIPMTDPTLDAYADMVRRRELAAVMEREGREWAHRIDYPFALFYGRHANTVSPVKEVHYLQVGGEYVGRHRGD
jgi:hypothetical protein